MNIFVFWIGIQGTIRLPLLRKIKRRPYSLALMVPHSLAIKRMSFGLCNAPGTFQICMMAIFSDMVEKSIEIFMDDFSVIRSSFEECL